jgi:exosortase/archaeosortase family protein
MKVQNKQPLKFIVVFLVLFIAFFYTHVVVYSLTSPGGHYSAFFAHHLDYIDGLRWLLIKCTATVLKCLGYTTVTNDYELLVAGRGIIHLAYDCLGLGVMSFFAAFVIAFPKPVKPKLVFLFSGLLAIQLLNILRFVVLALFWDKRKIQIVDHHTLFNIFIYIVIMISLYLWVKAPTTTNTNAAD